MLHLFNGMPEFLQALPSKSAERLEDMILTGYCEIRESGEV